ncbi:MAG: thioredoxin domain-containing protein [Deltaproteobacteria bacterium]|nr:thioredoxin domain-containing protein [Deltaproteobacteria bacterium]MBW2413460.1 thioredoxin domain-containing protein [Deltaproteobacteria bacterium]
MKRLTTLALTGVLAIGATACQQSDEQMREIMEQQALILEKLGKIEEGLAGTRVAGKRAQRPTEDYKKVYEIAYVDALVKGNPNAPVTLTEWSDFQCPYCAGVTAPIEALLEKYPEKLRVVYKHFPLSFHPAAKPAAVASMAANEQGCFWEYHDVLFDKTSKRQLDGAKLEQYASDAGCNVDQFKADLEKNSAAYTARVDADYKEGSAVDVRGTPALYINGRKVRDRSVPGMSAMIEAAAKEAAGGE